MRIAVTLVALSTLAGCGSLEPAAALATASGTLSIQATVQSDCQAGDPCDATNTWDLTDIGIDPSHRQSFPGAPPIVVATIDTGIDPNQPAFAGSLEPMIDLEGSDIYRDGSRAITYAGRDGNGHGTHVAGTILAVAGTGSVKILPVKAIGNTGQGDDATIAAAIRQATDWRDPQDPAVRVRVMNLSIGGKLGSVALGDAIRYAVSQGVVLVAASGNQAEGVDFPASIPQVIAVGASTVTDELASYSNCGPSLALVAPGGDDNQAVWSTWPTYLTATDLDHGATQVHDHASMVGTSMAAPHVTGAVALLLEQDPTMTPQQVRDRLSGAAVNLGLIGPNPYFGAGLLSVSRALADWGPDAP